MYTREEISHLIIDKSCHNELFEKAKETRNKYFQNRVYVRGLIEVSTFCKNDCYYCGIRCGNKDTQRTRLSKKDILSCCYEGNNLGFRTFVLQGGEDSFFNDDYLEEIIYEIKNNYPQCAITLSLGERNYNSYKRLFNAGADRYLLRHETADNEHYKKLHPPYLSLENRKKCLYNLKEIGYQTGAGFMVCSPYQSIDTLVEDIMFLQDLQPEMVGIGPFLPHNKSPFKDHIPKLNGYDSLYLSCVMLSITRLVLPRVLLPATTAMSTLSDRGRFLALESGSNVIMPNLSPGSMKTAYNLYNNKKFWGNENAEALKKIEDEIISYGYRLDMSRGDYK